MTGPVPGGRIPRTGHVEGWHIPFTDRALAQAHMLYDALDAAERRRLRQFHRSGDQMRYVLAHAGLRRVLGLYTGLEPGAVAVFRHPCPTCGRPHGKPALRDFPGLHFSLSHSARTAVVAVASAPVGVDVEEHPSALAGLDAADLFHPVERKVLGGLAPARREEALLHCWVRKEAYLKGRGVGLTEELDLSYVGFGARFADCSPEPSAASLDGWTLAPLPIPEGHVGAVALRVSARPAAAAAPPRVTVRELNPAALLRRSTSPSYPVEPQIGLS
ncbi:4'-phosphopantetheinyl transferase family protein [Streptomyces sp. NPDC033754]|uniref:4'-phosphopantetheinyl transferase family protein n=1 Tax=unclassified Streptomyces TaxID=2593676 RepID=UPI0033F1199D